MAISAGDLVLKLTVDDKGLKTGLNNAEREAEGFSKRVGQAFLGVATAAIAIGTAISVIAVKSINFADELVDIADAVGMTTDEVQKLAFALKFEGIQAGTITSIMKFMSNAMETAATSQATATEETKAFTDAFTRLNINLKDFQGLTTAEQIDTLFRALANVSDANERASLTTDVLGRSGIELLPVIQEWAKNQDRLNQLLKDFGIPEGALRDMAAMKADMETFKIALQYIGMQITNNLMPALKIILPYLPEFAKKLADMITPENIGNVKELAELFLHAADAVIWVIEKLLELNKAIGSILHPDWAPLIKIPGFNVPEIAQTGVGSHGVGTPGFPFFASGGIAMTPQLAMVGEAGPEAIVPLSRGGFGTVNHYHFAGFISDPMALRQFAREIEGIQSQETKRSVNAPTKTSYYSETKHL